MPRQNGATYIEWVIGGSILIMMTFSIIDFVLSYAARSAIHRGAQDALSIAVSHPNIASLTSENIEQIFNDVDSTGRSFPESLFIGTVDAPKALANLVLDQNDRAFRLVRPTPASGQTLMTALQERPIGMEVTYQRTPLFRKLSFGLLGSDTVSETVRVYGYAELPPIPAVNRAEICMIDKSDGGSGGGGPQNGTSIDTTCATNYCNGNDEGGNPRCSAGQNRCYLDGLECIPCADGFNPSHSSKTCTCPLTCNTVTFGQNRTYFKPDLNCENCICDAAELVAACKARELDRNDRSCAKVPNFAACKCDPAPNCSVAACEANPSAWCTCNLTAEQCQALLGSPTAGLDEGNCSCIDCGSGTRGGVAGANGFCTCPQNPPNCPTGATRRWWRNNMCECACDWSSGWETDASDDSEESGTLACKCRTNFTQTNPTTCKCNLTDALCGAGMKARLDHCDCKCTASGYTDVGGTCTKNECLLENCDNRRNMITDPTSGAIIACECGGGS